MGRTPGMSFHYDKTKRMILLFLLCFRGQDLLCFEYKYIKSFRVILLNRTTNLTPTRPFCVGRDYLVRRAPHEFTGFSGDSNRTAVPVSTLPSPAVWPDESVCRVERGHMGPPSPPPGNRSLVTTFPTLLSSATKSDSTVWGFPLWSGATGPVW